MTKLVERLRKLAIYLRSHPDGVFRLEADAPDEAATALEKAVEALQGMIRIADFGAEDSAEYAKAVEALSLIEGRS